MGHTVGISLSGAKKVLSNGFPVTGAVVSSHLGRHGDSAPSFSRQNGRSLVSSALIVASPLSRTLSSPLFPGKKGSQVISACTDVHSALYLRAPQDPETLEKAVGSTLKL